VEPLSGRVSFEVAEKLNDRGLVTDQLWRQLETERPGRAADIRKQRRIFAEQPAHDDDHPGAPPPPPEEPVRHDETTAHDDVDSRPALLGSDGEKEAQRRIEKASRQGSKKLNLALAFWFNLAGLHLGSGAFETQGYSRLLLRQPGRGTPYRTTTADNTQGITFAGVFAQCVISIR